MLESFSEPLVESTASLPALCQAYAREASLGSTISMLNVALPPSFTAVNAAGCVLMTGPTAPSVNVSSETTMGVLPASLSGPLMVT